MSSGFWTAAVHVHVHIHVAGVNTWLQVLAPSGDEHCALHSACPITNVTYLLSVG